jgi:hypothetical protein
MKREDIPVKTPDGRSQRITLSMVISVLALIVSISTFIISNLPHDSLSFILTTPSLEFLQSDAAGRNFDYYLKSTLTVFNTGNRAGALILAEGYIVMKAIPFQNSALGAKRRNLHAEHLDAKPERVGSVLVRLLRSHRTV